MEDGIAYCKIHPAIGIARIGNSPTEFFIGPEIPSQPILPSGGFKDAGEPSAGIPPRVKRQAARFRIFAYNSANEPVRELTAADADITWQVHLANSKAEGDRFDGAGEGLLPDHQRRREYWRNTGIDDRQSLIIDPGERSVAGRGQRASFDGGTFRGIPVPLGEIRTDEAGRLLVLGGFGHSGSSNDTQPLTQFANNDLWYDDVSDGPVKAAVTLKGGKDLPVTPAWVIVAPPDFAPAVESVVTLYDVLVDTALRDQPGSVPGFGARPSFTHHVAPIFRRLANLSAVQRDAGKLGARFADLGALANARPDERARIFAAFRNPRLSPLDPEARRQATADFLPALSGDGGDAEPGDPTRWLTLTRTQYDVLERWSTGDFDNDWTATLLPASAALTPAGLDRAALEACAGGPMYPGIEGGGILRNPRAYSEPFRLAADKLAPGSITRRMACPWQADFFECQSHWWPAQRPDHVLTLPAYRRLRQIDEQLEQAPDDATRRNLEMERQQLWGERGAWDRSLPADSARGMLAMVSRWPDHGFVVNTDQDGEPFTLQGKAVCVETERGPYDGLSWPEYFHILMNIAQHPDFIPKAREIAEGFFEGADFDAHENYAFFEYTPEAFDYRLKKMYDEYVLLMHEPSRMDSGQIDWPIVVRREADREITRNIPFAVGRFSDRVVRERLKQKAAFNLCDGAWLQRIQSVGPSDEIRAALFAIWADEAGNGLVNQSHANVYDALLRSINVYLPPVTSRKFIETDILVEAFKQPVFQLAVSIFPDDFFPELLGMTLYMEWEATPTMTPGVRHHRDRGINPHYISLHVAIDNITSGHGFLAKEAIKLYLQNAEDDGGPERVAEAWRRIWRGYVTWATCGGLGKALLELCLIIDHKQIDLNYPMMLEAEHLPNPARLVAVLRAAVRGGGDPFAAHLVSRFKAATHEALRDHEEAEPSQQLLGMVIDELNRLIQDDGNLYVEGEIPTPLLAEDTRALIAKAPSGELLVRLNRLLVRDAFAGLVADIPVQPPRLFPDYRAHFKDRFVQLIKKKAYAATPLHTRARIGDHNLADLFATPERLADVLATSDLINPQRPRDSRFFDLTSFTGPMYKIFTDAELDVILDWIESLRDESCTPTEKPKPEPQESAAAMLQFLRDYGPAAGQRAVHANHLVKGRPLRDWFSDPEGLIKAFAESPEWVEPGSAADSQLYDVFTTGPMSFLPARIKDVIRDWIDSGARLPGQDKGTPPSDGLLGGGRREFADEAAFARPAWSVDDRDRQFARRRKLIGMGTVH